MAEETKTAAELKAELVQLYKECGKKETLNEQEKAKLKELQEATKAAVEAENAILANEIAQLEVLAELKKRASAFETTETRVTNKSTGEVETFTEAGPLKQAQQDILTDEDGWELEENYDSIFSLDNDIASADDLIDLIVDKGDLEADDIRKDVEKYMAIRAQALKAKADAANFEASLKADGMNIDYSSANWISENISSRKEAMKSNEFIADLANYSPEKIRDSYGSVPDNEVELTEKEREAKREADKAAVKATLAARRRGIGDEKGDNPLEDQQRAQREVGELGEQHAAAKSAVEAMLKGRGAAPPDPDAHRAAPEEQPADQAAAPAPVGAAAPPPPPMPGETAAAPPPPPMPGETAAAPPPPPPDARVGTTDKEGPPQADSAKAAWAREFLNKPYNSIESRFERGDFMRTLMDAYHSDQDLYQRCLDSQSIEDLSRLSESLTRFKPMRPTKAEPEPEVENQKAAFEALKDDVQQRIDAARLDQQSPAAVAPPPEPPPLPDALKPPAAKVAPEAGAPSTAAGASSPAADASSPATGWERVKPSASGDKADSVAIERERKSARASIADRNQSPPEATDVAILLQGWNEDALKEKYEQSRAQTKKLSEGRKPKSGFFGILAGRMKRNPKRDAQIKHLAALLTKLGEDKGNMVSNEEKASVAIGNIDSLLADISNERNYKESGLGKMLLEMREEINNKLPKDKQVDLKEESMPKVTPLNPRKR